LIPCHGIEVVRRLEASEFKQPFAWREEHQGAPSPTIVEIDARERPMREAEIDLLGFRSYVGEPVGHDPGGPALRLDRAIDLYLGELARKGHSPRTRDDYSRKLAPLCDGDVDPPDVTAITANRCRGHLDRWLDRAPGGSGRTRPAAQATASPT
jgi:hypothetical protein